MFLMFLMFLYIFYLYFSTGKANSLKRLSKACRILGEFPRSAALAQEAFDIYKKTFNEVVLDHREVSLNLESSTVPTLGGTVITIEFIYTS